MVSQMRNLENAARLAMAHSDASIVARPAAPVGLVRRFFSQLARVLFG